MSNFPRRYPADGHFTLDGHVNKWYLAAIQEIVEYGDVVTTRGRTTWEVLHALTTLPDPRKRVLTIPYRRSNPFFQAMECVWILAGRSDANWLTYYNSQMAQFLDTYETGARPIMQLTGELSGWVAGDVKKHENFHGAYGERLLRWGEHSKTQERRSTSGWILPGRNQIKDVILQLLAEATSRRAVMTIHNPLFDNPETKTLDRPCNIAMTYQLRQGQLHAVTFNRSNDLNLGLAFTNSCQFTTIQEFIAAALGVDVGDYVHFSSSLHVYDDDPIVQRVIALNKLAMSHHDTGPSAAKELIRKWDEFAFDVYDYVQPVPMKRWTKPDEGWDTITYLSGAGDPYNGWLFPPTQYDCPYWFSVACMASAWHVLKHSGPEDATVKAALAHVGRMEAPDWQIACTEYIHRWAGNRGLQHVFLKALESSDMGKRWPQPVLDFVLHDGLAAEGKT
jgi:thymidylate synthase